VRLIAALLKIAEEHLRRRRRYHGENSQGGCTNIDPSVPFTGLLIKLHRVEGLRPNFPRPFVLCQKPDGMPLGKRFQSPANDVRESFPQRYRLGEHSPWTRNCDLDLILLPDFGVANCCGMRWLSRRGRRRGISNGKWKIMVFPAPPMMDERGWFPATSISGHDVKRVRFGNESELLITVYCRARKSVPTRPGVLRFQTHAYFTRPIYGAVSMQTFYVE